VIECISFSRLGFCAEILENDDREARVHDLVENSATRTSIGHVLFSLNKVTPSILNNVYAYIVYIMFRCKNNVSRKDKTSYSLKVPTMIYKK
jgi:hypothetical protein